MPQPRAQKFDDWPKRKPHRRQRQANRASEKNETHRAHETWRRGKIAPFGMEVRAVTHFTYLGYCLWGREESEGIRAQLHCTLGNAPPLKRGKTLNVRIGLRLIQIWSLGLFPRPCRLFHS